MSQSQLYEWIKASEKLPQPLISNYLIIHGNSPNPEGTWKAVGFYGEEENVFFLASHDYRRIPPEDVEWLSPVSTDWWKLEKELLEEAGVKELRGIDGFKVFFWIKQRIELLSQQHSPDVDSVVSLPCASGNNVQQLITAYDEYIAILRKEIDGLIGLANVHGWKSSLVEAGKQGREKIATAKALLTSTASKDIEVEQENELSDLVRLRNYFGEKDKTEFEHWAYNFLSGIISRAKFFRAVRDKTKK